MKLTLMIEGSAAVIAQILASLPEGASAAPFPAPTTSMPNAGTGIPSSATAMIPGASDDDDDGTPSDAATDNTGLPWDERIHASTKALTAKGEWKKRRGVDPATVAAVEAELRAPTAAVLPQPVAIPTMGMPQAMQTPTPMPLQQPMPVQTPQPMTQAMPVVEQQPTPVAAMPQAAPAGLSFPEFMQTLGTQMQGETPVIKQENVAWVAQQLGLASIGDLGVNPDKIEQAVGLFRQYGLWPN